MIKDVQILEKILIKNLVRVKNEILYELGIKAVNSYLHFIYSSRHSVSNSRLEKLIFQFISLKIVILNNHITSFNGNYFNKL